MHGHLVTQRENSGEENHATTCTLPVIPRVQNISATSSPKNINVQHLAGTSVYQSNLAYRINSRGKTEPKRTGMTFGSRQQRRCNVSRTFNRMERLVSIWK